MARRKPPPPRDAIAIRQSLWSGVEKVPRSSIPRRDDGRFGGLHRGLLNRLCLAPLRGTLARARLELPARGDTSHHRAPVALLIAAKTDVDPDRAFLRPPRFRMRWRRGAGRNSPAGCVAAIGRHQSGACQLDFSSFAWPPKGRAAQLCENVDITDSNCGLHPPQRDS